MSYRGSQNVKPFLMEAQHGGLELAPGATTIPKLSTGTIGITTVTIALHVVVEMIMTITRGGNLLMIMSKLGMAGGERAGDHTGQAVIQTQYRMMKVLGGEEEAEGHGGQVITLTPSLRVMITLMGRGADIGTRERGGNDQPTLMTSMKEILRVSLSRPTPVITLRVTVRVSGGHVVGYDPALVPLPFLMQPGPCRGGGGRGRAMRYGSSHSKQRSRSY